MKATFTGKIMSFDNCIRKETSDQLCKNNLLVKSTVRKVQSTRNQENNKI